MMGGAIKKSAAETVYVNRSEEVVAGVNGVVPKPKDHLTGRELTVTASTTYPVRVINLTKGIRTQLTSGSISGTQGIKFINGSDTVNSAEGDHIRLFWTEEVTSSSSNSAVEVTISPNTFPGTYKVVGDTFMRSEKTGKDEAFQFIINKAKVDSNVTLTLEAEGDPATFEMTLTVLRDVDDKTGDAQMMRLVRYGEDEETSSASGDDNGSLFTPGSDG